MLNNNEIYYEFCLEQAKEEQSIFESVVMFEYSNLLEGAEEPLEEGVKDITANIKKAIETLIDNFLGFLEKIKKSIDEKINSTMMKQLNELAKKAKEKATTTGASLEYSKEYPSYTNAIDELQKKIIVNIESNYKNIDHYSAKVAEGKVVEKDLNDLKELSTVEKVYEKIAGNNVKTAKQFAELYSKTLFTNNDKQKVTLTKDDIILIADNLIGKGHIYLSHVNIKKQLDENIKEMKDIRKKVSKIKPEGDNGTLLAQVISEFRNYISSMISVDSSINNILLNGDYARINVSKAILKAYLSENKSKEKDEPTSAKESTIVESDDEVDDDDIEDVDDVEVEEKCKKETCKTVKEMFDSKENTDKQDDKKEKEVEEKCDKESCKKECKTVKEMFESDNEEEEEIDESFFDIDDVELI